METSRRGLVQGIASVTAIPMGASLAANPAVAASLPHDRFKWTSEYLDYDPLTNFRQTMRLQRSLHDEDDILHWYHFIMVAVVPGKAPRPIVRWEGIELSRHRKIGEDLYRMHGHNLSFPRDLESLEFVDEVLNPITGEMVRPGIMALTEDPGIIYSPKGIITLDNPNGKYRMKYSKIRREGHIVKIDGMRVPPAEWPATFLEMGYEQTPAQLFDDPAQLWLPTDVSGAYVFPYPKWMKMGDRPGHMFAAWSGYKLRSVEQLPSDFLARANDERPDLLHVDLTQFDRPFTPPD